MFLKLLINFAKLVFSVLPSVCESFSFHPYQCRIFSVKQLLISKYCVQFSLISNDTYNFPVFIIIHLLSVLFCELLACIFWLLVYHNPSGFHFLQNWLSRLFICWTLAPWSPFLIFVTRILTFGVSLFLWVIFLLAWNIFNFYIVKSRFFHFLGN